MSDPHELIINRCYIVGTATRRSQGEDQVLRKQGWRQVYGMRQSGRQEWLRAVGLSPDQSRLIHAHRRPPGCNKVLRLPQTPAEDVHQQAAHSCRGPASVSVTVNIDSVTILQQTMKQKHSLGKHPDTNALDSFDELEPQCVFERLCQLDVAGPQTWFLSGQQALLRGSHLNRCPRVPAAHFCTRTQHGDLDVRRLRNSSSLLNFSSIPLNSLTLTVLGPCIS
ncbi:hypothetical protein EYF80_021249 [Liparis tanakae]|uniref:Uncharacterized protein n=1 Tax=Liparis tanakae TaxID=230148 RepID=A0A4Z2HTY9_9TELE|nr:hypothetical protein EYF80_021249 [Liparis tanakae]